MLLSADHRLSVKHRLFSYIGFHDLSATWARFLSLAWSKLRLWSANHRADYFSNLACDWLSIVWAYSEQETEKTGPVKNYSTHRGRVTHICIGSLAIIGSDNGLSPGWHQAIIWINAGILLIQTLETNIREILIQIHKISFKKRHGFTSVQGWMAFLVQWSASLGVRRSGSLCENPQVQLHCKPNNISQPVQMWQCLDARAQLFTACLCYNSKENTINKANLRDLIAATGLVISNWIQIINFSARVTVKFDGWPWKTIGHFFYTTSSVVHHFKYIGEFKLDLQSRNAQFGSKLVICYPVWPWNLIDDFVKQ